MKNLIPLMLLALSFFLAPYGYAQSKYGNVTMEEMTMEVYPQDTAATAVVLSKTGNARFIFSQHKLFQFEYTVQTKIKILKTEGLDWCDQEIEYYEPNRTDKEDIRGLSGTTYNLEDGKIQKVKLSKEHIFDEDIDVWKIKKFTMPAAKVGSVIEFKYTIVSDFYWMLRDFTFQESIPVAYSVFDITIPEFFQYTPNYQGYLRFNTESKAENENFHVAFIDRYGVYQDALRCTSQRTITEVKDAPAMKKENYVWAMSDYVSKVSYELKRIDLPFAEKPHNITSTSWAKVAGSYMNSNLFGKRLKEDKLFKDEISKGETTMERAREIQDMIKYKVKWNDRNNQIPGNLSNALKKGEGNSAEVNFLLINALKSAGFDAFPVLLRTRDSGRMPMFRPTERAFNYVITGIQIDTVRYYTDAVAKYGNWNLLPEECMVPNACELRDERFHWRDLSTIAGSSSVKMSNYDFADSKINIKVAETLKGNTAYDARLSYSNSKDENEYIEKKAKQLETTIDDFQISNLDNTAEVLKMNYIQIQDMNLDEDIIYINPMVEKLYSTNPFKEETREYPVQFDYLTTYVQITDIPIPAGFVVDETPRSERILFKDSNIVLTYRVIKSDDQVRLHYQYQLKKLLFLPDEYQDLRTFFSNLVLKNSEMIVLKKAVNVEENK